MNELYLRKKHPFDNEPYCPACGKETSPLYMKLKEKFVKAGALSYQPVYCRKCKEIYIKNGIYFGMRKDYSNTLEVVK